MMYLSQVKKSTAEFISNHPVLTAAAVGYGATHAYSVLNPVGGAILFATFVQTNGLKPQKYVQRNTRNGRLITYEDSNIFFCIKKIKACVLAWGAAYYVTPYANLATGAKVFLAVISVLGKIASLISLIASKAFASLLAMPSQMFTTTAFAINSINLPAIAATVAVVVAVVSLYKFCNYLSKKNEENKKAFFAPMKADIASLKADIATIETII